MNSDYDDLFGYYVSYIEDEVPGVLESFMEDENGPGNKYFDCTWQTQFGYNETTQTCPFPDNELGEGTYTLTSRSRMRVASTTTCPPTMASTLTGSPSERRT